MQDKTKKHAKQVPIRENGSEYLYTRNETGENRQQKNVKLDKKSTINLEDIEKITEDIDDLYTSIV